MKQTISSSGESLLVIMARSNSNSKSALTLRPRTITGAPTLVAKSTVRPAIGLDLDIGYVFNGLAGQIDSLGLAEHEPFFRRVVNPDDDLVEHAGGAQRHVHMPVSDGVEAAGINSGGQDDCSFR